MEVMFGDQQNMMMVSSSRWNPTPEQLLALEELYRRGIRTPTTEQIQQIARSLRRFGKIEGKNVFYWFQNHKARERQKRRREEEASVAGHEDRRVIENVEKKGSGRGRTVFETDKITSWVSSSTCNRVTEDLISVNWAQQSERGKEDDRMHDRWQDQKLLYYPPALNPLANTTTVTITSQLSSLSSASSIPSCCSIVNMPSTLEVENRESKTLELFPLRGDSDIGDNNVSRRDTRLAYTTRTASTRQRQYFEFIPLKN